MQLTVNSLYSSLEQGRLTVSPDLNAQEVGTVTSVSTGIAVVSGLPNVGFDELLFFGNDLYGIAFNLDEDEIGVVMLGDAWHLNVGDDVKRTGRVMDIAVGPELLGRVIDPLGRPLDGNPQPALTQRLPIERPAPAIIQRSPVTEPLQTGIKVIDALLPIGRGQRELILGDRQTGKTAIAIDTILNQKGKNVLCVYCAIGQKAASVAKTLAVLKANHAMEYTVVLVTEGNNPPGLDYIAPYAATSVAEYFMEAGEDVLIVYDDLTQHARSYRELSLLLRRPPGREAFPGDIFYLHSRLLERSTHLNQDNGGGSLTALPIIETEGQNMSAYIPTNLISITDGQIYLSPTLFDLGVLPAVDVGKSVSRVGGKAQRDAYRKVASDLKLAYAQFEELESFARFGARLDDDTLSTIDHGRHIRAYFSQSESDPLTVAEQITLLLVLGQHLFDAVPLSDMQKAQTSLRSATKGMPEALITSLENAQNITDEDKSLVIKIAKQTLAPFINKTTSEDQNHKLEKHSTESTFNKPSKNVEKHE
jgi:F-type H+-transporting ATPase subunit alpha